MTRYLRSAAAIGALLLAHPVAAQTQVATPQNSAAQIKPTQVVTDKAASPQGTFRESFKQFESNVETLTKEIGAQTERLKTITGTSVESRKVEVNALRERLTQLGSLLQPDGPFASSVENFDSWLSAQVGRTNGQRQSLGREFVDQLIAKYQASQQEVTKARELLNVQGKSLNRLLEELTTAEMRAAEALQVEDAEAAATSLKQTIDKLGQEIGAIRDRIKELGSAGV